MVLKVERLTMANGTEYMFYLFPASHWGDRSRLRKRYPFRFWTATLLIGMIVLTLVLAALATLTGRA